MTMENLALTIGLAALLLTAAIFGFFYAWACSAMWGLDVASPQVAIEAMQAINIEVRNVVFAPAFFGTGPALLLAALAMRMAGNGSAALWFALAAALYFIGAFVVTVTGNVPLNNGLAEIAAPADTEEAAAIWRAYSQPWQYWNWVRTAASGGAVMLAAVGLVVYGRSLNAL